MKKEYKTPSVIVYRINVLRPLMAVSSEETLQEEKVKFFVEEDDDVVLD